MREQVEALSVRAGLAGVVQAVLIEEGAQVQPGANIARVAQPDELMAELRVPETQVKDVVIDLPVAVDTRNGIVAGKVIRIDPASVEGTVQVDVELTGKLPRGARPDQSVDGTIEITRLPDVVKTGRCTYCQANSMVTLFKLVDEGDVRHARARPDWRHVGQRGRDRRRLGARRRGHPLRHLGVGRRGPHPAELTMLANLVHDVRYALHGFALRPMFAVVVVLTLAIGIGVNVAVFSLFDRIMLRELNVANPRELVNLAAPTPEGPINRTCNQQGRCDQTFSYAMFRDLERAGEAFVDLAASRIIVSNFGRDGSAALGSAVLVSGSYFAALGIGPEIGRVLGEQDVGEEPAASAVLSYDYWQTAYARRSSGARQDARRRRSPADDRRGRAARFRRRDARRAAECLRAADSRVVSREAADSAFGGPALLLRVRVRSLATGYLARASPRRAGRHVPGNA